MFINLAEAIQIIWQSDQSFYFPTLRRSCT